MGKIGLLDQLLLFDFRFLVVLAVAAALYFRPALVREGVSGSALDGKFTIAVRRRPAVDSAALVSALLIGLLCWLGVGVASLLAQSIRWPLIHDAPLMHYIAWRIAHGAVPYRDIFDMNLPGVYLIHLGVLKVFGESDGGWRLFDFLWLAGTATLLWKLCRPLAEGWSVVAVLGYCAFHLSCGAPAMGQRDYLEFGILAAGVWLAVRAMERGGGVGMLLGSGLSFGYAMSIKPLAALLWLAMAALVCLAPAASSRRLPRSSGLVLVLAGLAVPLAFTVWLAVIGGLQPFLATFAGVMPLYSRMHDRPFVAYLAENWPVWLPCLLTVPVALMGGRLDVRRRALALGVVYGALHYLLQGKGWLYQLYPLVGFGGALLACTLGSASRSTDGQLRYAVAALAALFIVCMGAWDWRLRPSMALTADTTDTVASLQADLQPRLLPGMAVQTFDTTGGCSHALFRLHRPLPTRFLCDFLLYSCTEQPYVQRIHSELMSALNARPPEFLVVYRWGWPAGQYERLQRFPELSQWMQANYRLDVTRNKYVIYRLRSLAH